MSAKIFLAINAALASCMDLAFAPVLGSFARRLWRRSRPARHSEFLGSSLARRCSEFGVVFWFAKDFRDWDAVRGVLIANVVADIVGGLVNLSGTLQGLLNAMAWSSTIVYVLLVAGCDCIAKGPSKQA